jgi:predicted PurR-regulated permease PerM
MARIISLVVLIVILLAIAGLFFRVMANFWLPLFLALLLVVMFGPLHGWFSQRCGGRGRVSALLTTTTILLMVLAPLLALLIEAGYEAQSIYRVALDHLPPAGAQASSRTPANRDLTDVTALTDEATHKLVAFSERFGINLDPKDVETNITQTVEQFLAPLALRTTQFLGQMLLGLLVMILAVYYFFADGSAMVEAILRLTPLERHRTQELLDQFDSVTRAVVAAMLLTAFSQAVLVGLGFYVAGVGSVFLLSVFTSLLALVPFVGSAIVWGPVCFWLYAVQGRGTAALGLLIYCLVTVTVIDNIVKPAVLHGRSNLHPLLALLSVLGGIQALGPIGIFVGPMAVAFLQTLLNMVHTELNSMKQSDTAAG